MGQVCTATSRIYVQEGVYETFIQAFKIHVQEVTKIGNPFSEDTSNGPQVSKGQWEKIMKYIAIGQSEGAKLVYGGNRHGKTGYFVTPTIFVDIKDDMVISQEEIFGPVVTITSFKTEEDVIKRANNSKYGLAAAIFTQDITRAHKIAAKIQAGMVWVSLLVLFLKSAYLLHPIRSTVAMTVILEYLLGEELSLPNFTFLPNCQV